MSEHVATIERPTRGVNVVWVLVLAVVVWLPGLFLTRAIPTDRTDGPTPQVERAIPLPHAPPVDSEDEGQETWLERLAELRNDGRRVAQIVRENAMIRAAEAGDTARVRRALAAGASVNARYVDAVAGPCTGNNGRTALMLSSAGGHASVIKVLIEHEADPNIECNGRTALHYAALGEHAAATRLLVDAGAKGDPKKIRLEWELVRAACKGYKMADWEGFPPYPGAPDDLDSAPELKEVLQQGADVNAVNPDGHTALMYAANLGLIDNVRVLLAAGADAETKSKNGATALYLAEQENKYFRPAARREVATLLREHMSRRR